MSSTNQHIDDQKHPYFSAEITEGTITNNRVGWFSIWKYELFNKNYGVFDMVEVGMPPNSLIHVEGCFAPNRRFLVTELARLIMCVFTIVMFFVSIYNEWYDGRRHMFFAYLTNWTLSFTILYQILALLVTFRRNSILAQPSSAKPGYIVTLMWFLYSFVLPMNVMVVSMYWTVEYPAQEASTIKFVDIFPHGISCFFVILDGFIVSTIPLRMKQVIFPMMYGFTYTVWSLIHGLVLDIGNGEDKNANLYSIIDWKNKPVGTLVVVTLMIFFALPLMFTILWTLSLWSPCCKFDGSHRPIVNRQNDSSIRNDPKYGSVHFEQA